MSGLLRLNSKLMPPLPLSSYGPRYLAPSCRTYSTLPMALPFMLHRTKPTPQRLVTRAKRNKGVLVHVSHDLLQLIHMRPCHRAHNQISFVARIAAPVTIHLATPPGAPSNEDELLLCLIHLSLHLSIRLFQGLETSPPPIPDGTPDNPQSPIPNLQSPKKEPPLSRQLSLHTLMNRRDG